MTTEKTVQSVLDEAASVLKASGSESPLVDASVLLCHALDKPRSYLYTWPDKVLSEDQLSAFSPLLARRIKGEPVAYIIGQREFWSLSLFVSPSTLIPRPDTERLVELALDKAPAGPAFILDLGTGTGAIALALASELPQHHILGIDLMPEAKLLAEKNARHLGITNAHFLQGSWFEPLELVANQSSVGDWVSGTKFALIVSNPPYIDECDPHLAKGDVRFEPKSALVAAGNGYADIEYIAAHAMSYLADQGWLMFEHGFEQGEQIRQLLRDLGYNHVATETDYAGNERVTYGQYHEER